MSENYFSIIRKTVFFLLLSTFTLSSTISGCEPEDIRHTSKPTKYVLIGSDNNNYQYHGRIDHSFPSQPKLFYAGSGITTFFKGDTVKIALKDDDGNNYYSVIIDGDLENITVIDCVPGDQVITIAAPGDKQHKIEIFRRTDPTTSYTVFKGLYVEEGSTITAPEELHELKIEFYGNSITSGHGILDETRDNNDDRATWDNYLTYAAITARELNAEYRCISRSGIGILKSWYPLVMPEMYNRLNPNATGSTWNFSNWQADIVVINLFQNDSWLLGGTKTKEEIVQAYFDFIQNIRTAYPLAEIFCTLGNMDITRTGSPWPDYVVEAVSRINQETEDYKVYSHSMPYKNTGGHPTVSEHQDMADLLVPFIRETLGIEEGK